MTDVWLLQETETFLGQPPIYLLIPCKTPPPCRAEGAVGARPTGAVGRGGGRRAGVVGPYRSGTHAQRGPCRHTDCQSRVWRRRTDNAGAASCKSCGCPATRVQDDSSGTSQGRARGRGGGRPRPGPRAEDAAELGRHVLAERRVPPTPAAQLGPALEPGPPCLRHT